MFRKGIPVILYDEVYFKLERIRWNMETDVPWDQIDRSLITREELEHVRLNALTELSALYAEEMFIRDFYHDTDFCQFMSVWYFEEMKHFLVLKEYLKRFDMAPTEEEMSKLRITFEPADWRDTLAMHFVGEQRLGMWYTAWGHAMREPVLKKIYSLLAADEFRHANVYFRYMMRAVQKDPANLKRFLTIGLFMLKNPQRDKHPTSLRVNGSSAPSVIDKLDDPQYVRKAIERWVSDEDERKMDQRVMTLFSKLANRVLKSPRDLIAAIRSLETPIEV